MKNANAFKKIIAVLLWIGIAFPPMVFPSGSSFAQVLTLPQGTSIAGERRPSLRDPAYVPPVLPRFMREKLKNVDASLLVSPDGGANYAARLNKQKIRARKRELARERYEFREFSPSADSPADRLRFERGVLRQFGVTDLEYGSAAAEPYRESALRRFSVVFGLALPITLVFSFGLVTAVSRSRIGARSLTGPETAAFVGLGFLSAGGVAYYDYRKWKAPGAPPASEPAPRPKKSLLPLAPGKPEKRSGGRLNFSWSFSY